MDINEEKQKLYQLEEEQKKQSLELKQKLMLLRNKDINSIAAYNKKIEAKRRELDEINTQICSIFGHEFTEWEEKEDRYLDRSWYYDRHCTICGKQEHTYTEPDEYITRGNNGITLHIRGNIK